MIKEVYKVGDEITREDITEFNKYGDMNPKIIQKIPNESTVYFRESCDYPRKQFLKLYPTCRKTFKIEEADIIVFKDYCIEHVHFDFPWLRNANGGYAGQSSVHTLTPSSCKRLNEHLTLIKKLNEKFVIRESLLFLEMKSDKIINQEQRTKISEMLNSGARDTQKLGWNILFDFPFEFNEDMYILIIASARAYMPTGRYPKLLKKRIKDKYPKLNQL